MKKVIDADNTKCIPANCDEEDDEDNCFKCHPGALGNGNEGSVGYVLKADKLCQA